MTNQEIMQEVNVLSETKFFDNEKELSVFYIIGKLAKLREKGLIEVPLPYILPDKGKIIFAKIEELGYKLLEEEIDEVLGYLADKFGSYSNEEEKIKFNKSVKILINMTDEEFKNIDNEK